MRNPPSNFHVCRIYQAYIVLNKVIQPDSTLREDWDWDREENKYREWDAPTASLAAALVVISTAKAMEKLALGNRCPIIYPSVGSSAVPIPQTCSCCGGDNSNTKMMATPRGWTRMWAAVPTLPGSIYGIILWGLVRIIIYG